MSEPDHYLALGVAPDATTDEVRDAWRFAVQAFHPDRFTDPSLREQADRMARRVNAAWQVLGDADQRARYDRTRRGRRSPSEAPGRELPCPACGTLSMIADQQGAAASVRCPACAQRFTAMIGARLVGRPQLQMRFLGGRYRLELADATGARSRVQVRRLPPELALADGETLSLVFGADGRRVRYIVVHGARTDIGWKVR